VSLRLGCAQVALTLHPDCTPSPWLTTVLGASRLRTLLVVSPQDARDLPRAPVTGESHSFRRRQALREQLERLRRHRDPTGGEKRAALDDRDLALRIVCDDRLVSRRDLVHVLTALWRLSSGNLDVGVPVAQIDEAIGRGHGDMRTPLNLQSLSDERLAVRLPDGTWALTPQGLAWLKQDHELSDR
jgi:hypothetical protein